MTPIGRPEVGPAISTRFTDSQLVRVDGAAARAGQSRAEWLRSSIDAALGDPLEVEAYPHDAFTRATHTPSFTDEGRFDDLVLTMTESEWALDQTDPDARTGRMNGAQVQLSGGGSETPTGPAVSDLLQQLSPWIERVILDCEVENGRLVLGDDAQYARAHVKKAVVEAELETIADRTDNLVDHVDDTTLADIAVENIDALVAEQAADLQCEADRWVDEAEAIKALTERWEDLQHNHK